MKLFGVTLLAICAQSIQSGKSADLVIDEDYFRTKPVLHSSENDIVNLYLPLNALNAFNNTATYEKVNDEPTLFFVEGVRDNDGIIDSKGLYVLKDKVVTKLLDNGRDFIAPADDSKVVYFAATDGLYVYNAEKNTAEKYGGITDSIISIAMKQTDNSLFIVTEDKHLYKVTDGYMKVKIAEVNEAVEVRADFESNIYYYGSDKIPYVITEGGVKKFEGVPSNHSEVHLLTSVFSLKNGMDFIADDKVYVIFQNGYCFLMPIEFKEKPTAYAIDGSVIQYYAYNKKIYSDS